MISPDTMLSIYEISGDVGAELPTPPLSFIGVWNEEELSYLFFTKPESEYIDRLIAARSLSLSACHEMRYQDWQTGLPHQGLEVGGVLFVPADHPNPPPRAILLDPSVVFGDGAHPTTLRCLRLLARITAGRTVTSMLDAGTGTGILALAAAEMGVKNILAVDRNHLAVQTCRRNVESNSASSVIRVELGEARLFVNRPFDLVAANLPFQVLRDLVVMDGVSLHRNWIVSGINAEQGEVLKELLREQGHEVESEYSDPPWTTFSTANKALKG